MPLFRVQDSDRPMFVVADDFQQAIDRWRAIIVLENPDDDCSQTNPDGVEFLANDQEIILGPEIGRLRGEVQRLTDDLADQVHQRAVYQALVEGVEIPPTCAVCGKPATCIGWSSDAGVFAACDDCCGHGNEDSWCEMVLPTRQIQAVQNT